MIRQISYPFPSCPGQCGRDIWPPCGVHRGDSPGNLWQLVTSTSSGELLTARSLNGKQPPSNFLAARLESAAIAEESEEEEVVVAVLGCASVGMVQGPPWRSRTRTNPYVNWCPPDSVARMEKLVEVTEL